MYGDNTGSIGSMGGSQTIRGRLQDLQIGGISNQYGDNTGSIGSMGGDQIMWGPGMTQQDLQLGAIIGALAPVAAQAIGSLIGGMDQQNLQIPYGCGLNTGIGMLSSCYRG